MSIWWWIDQTWEVTSSFFLLTVLDSSYLKWRISQQPVVAIECQVEVAILAVMKRTKVRGCWLNDRGFLFAWMPKSFLPAHYPLSFPESADYLLFVQKLILDRRHKTLTFHHKCIERYWSFSRSRVIRFLNSYKTR